MAASETSWGRCDDLFYLPGTAGGWVPVYHDYVWRALLNTLPALAGYDAQRRDIERAAALALGEPWQRVGAQLPDLTLLPCIPGSLE